MPQACRNTLMEINLQGGSHAGLVLDRYLKIANDGTPEFRSSRQELLNKVTGMPGKLGEVYRISFRQWNAALPVTAARSDFKVQGRFVSGLGASSPIETGLRLHHTFGIPVIPGSALKGLAAHFCDQVWGEQDPEFKRTIDETGPDGQAVVRTGNWFLAFFGTSEDRGHIIFHDAWILPEDVNGCLQPDVMTVHHPDYYQQQDGASGPTDFDDPTPIPFLSIRGKFRVAVSCDVSGEQGQQWAGLALTLLGQALEQWGVGGKTSAGYGHLTRCGGSGITQAVSAPGTSMCPPPSDGKKKSAGPQAEKEKKAGPPPPNPITEKLEQVTSTQEAKMEGKVLTSDGVEISCRKIPYPGVSKGERFKALVTRQGDVPLKAIFKSWK